MTPLHQEILLHHYTHPMIPFPRESQTITEFHRGLVKDGFLESGSEPGIYTTTKNGRALLESVLGTPFPEPRWVWE